MKYALISTYPVPRKLSKRVNLGDGFILEATKRALGIDGCVHVKSFWEPLCDFDVTVFNRCDAVFLVAANQLIPDFAISRGTPPEWIERIKIPIIPFGMGLHGEYSETKDLTDRGRLSMQLIMARGLPSSWRCPRTVAYLRRQFPEFSDRFVDTSCPVLTHGHGGLPSQKFSLSESPKQVLLTITDRADSIGIEEQALREVRQAWPSAKLALVLHQDLHKHGSFRDHWNRQRFLERLRGLDCEFIQLHDPAASMRLYREFDAHIGSRLHAHLACLSHGVPSLLIGIDGRSVGFAEGIGFSLWQSQNGSVSDQLKAQPWSQIEHAIELATVSMADFLLKSTQHIDNEPKNI
jgi:hypothetical protein